MRTAGDRAPARTEKPPTGNTRTPVRPLPNETPPLSACPPGPTPVTGPVQPDKTQTRFFGIAFGIYNPHDCRIIQDPTALRC